MTLLPVVERELRTASRRGWTYWGRCVVSLIALAVFAWMAFTLGGYGNSALLARASFQTLAWLCLGFTLVAGMLFSADCFARELREGTLGLLFLTDLRGVDIVLGKLAVTSLGSVYCLISVLPILAIPLLLGGVSGWEYVRVVAALLATLWASLTLGLLASTLGQDARYTGLTALLLMAGVLAAGPLAGELWWRATGRPLTGTDLATDLMSAATPLHAFNLAFESATPNLLEYFWASGFAVLAGALALVWATMRLPGLWQVGLGGGRAGQGRARKAVIAGSLAPPGDAPPGLGGAGVPASPSLRLMGGLSGPDSIEFGPIVWLSHRSRSRRYFPWIFLAMSAAGWLAIRWLAGHEWNTMPGWIATSLWVHLGLKSWLAVEAASFLHQERHSGGMELLLTTGLADSEIWTAAVRAMRRAYFRPLALVSAVDCAWFIRGLEPGFSGNDYRSLLAFFLGRMAMLWLDAEALAWTGTWVAVSTRGDRAGGGTWVRIVLTPYLLWVAGMMLYGLAEALHVVWLVGLLSRFNSRQFPGLILLGVVLNLSVSGFWWVRSVRRLRREFRARASLPLGKPAKA